MNSHENEEGHAECRLHYSAPSSHMRARTVSRCLFGKGLLALSLAALLGAGCAARPQSQSLPASNSGPSSDAATSPMVTEVNSALATASALQASGSTADYRLGPDDLIEITLFNVPESSAGIISR